MANKKCSKCGIPTKKNNLIEENVDKKTLCFKCSVIYDLINIFLSTFKHSNINREVKIDWDNIHINL
jgi:hypothetical protein